MKNFLTIDNVSLYFYDITYKIYKPKLNFFIMAYYYKLIKITILLWKVKKFYW